MNRSSFVLAAVAGIAVATGVASSQAGAPDPAGLVAPAPTTPPLSPAGGVLPQVAAPRVGSEPVLGTGGRRAIRGTVRIAATAPDPAGGPRWAVRTWQRRGQAGGRVWCAQLGRKVGGQFVWVVPGEGAAGPVPAREGETTVCAVSAPISERLGVMVASMPDRDAQDPSAQIASTVIWGVVDRPVREATLEHGGRVRAVAVQGQAVLEVLPGSAQATKVTLRVRDRDGSVRKAIPPAFFPMDGRATRGFRHISTPNVAQADELQPILRVTVGSDGRHEGIFVRPAAPGRPACIAGPTLMVAGRAAAQLDRRSGLVRQPEQSCNPLPPPASREPSPLSGGWTSGDPETPGTPQARAKERLRNERRTLYGSGGTLVGVPPGARLLEVRSPVGVKTVRVGPERVAWLGWDGQPEVQRAMYPPLPGSPQWEREIKTGHTPVSLRALDARGRQVGRTGYLGRVTYTAESIARGRRDFARMKRELERLRGERRRIAERVSSGLAR